MSESWKKYSKLKAKKYRQEWQLFLVEGTRLCREALRSDWEIEAAFLSESFAEKAFDNHWKRLFRERAQTYRVLTDSNFRRLADTQNPQGILLVLRMKPMQSELNKLLREKKFLLILEDIQDPGNIGTILRSADWFGADLVIVSAGSVDLYNPKVVRSSMGSLFHLSFTETNNLAGTIKVLRQCYFTVVSSAPQARNRLPALQVKPPLALILGSEARGVSPAIQQLATTTVGIPQYGEAESLNVAVAGGILMYHFSSIIYSEKSKYGRKYPENLPADKTPERGKNES